VFCCSIEPCGQQVVARHGVNLRCELHTAGLGNRFRNNVKRNPNFPLDVTVLPTRRSRAPPSHTVHALHSHETPFPSLSYRKFRYYSQHKKETIPHPFIPCDVRETIATRNFLSLAACQCNAHLFIFGSGGQGKCGNVKSR